MHISRKKIKRREREREKHKHTMMDCGIFFGYSMCTCYACWEQKVRRIYPLIALFQEECENGWCHGVWLYQWNEIMLWGWI